MYKLVAAALIAFTTLSTGCAAMGTKRPTGGAQITKTTSEDKTPTALDHDVTFDGRADLGQR